MEAFPDSEKRQERRFNRKGVVMNIHRVLRGDKKGSVTLIPVCDLEHVCDRYNITKMLLKVSYS